jgi:hypothetical protein
MFPYLLHIVHPFVSAMSLLLLSPCLVIDPVSSESGLLLDEWTPDSGPPFSLLPIFATLRLKPLTTVNASGYLRLDLRPERFGQASSIRRKPVCRLHQKTWIVGLLTKD